METPYDFHTKKALFVVHLPPISTSQMSQKKHHLLLDVSQATLGPENPPKLNNDLPQSQNMLRVKCLVYDLGGSTQDSMPYANPNHQYQVELILFLFSHNYQPFSLSKTELLSRKKHLLLMAKGKQKSLWGNCPFIIESWTLHPYNLASLQMSGGESIQKQLLGVQRHWIAKKFNSQRHATGTRSTRVCA